MTNHEIAKEYAKTWSGAVDDLDYVDLGVPSNLEDFFEFLRGLAKSGKIVALEEYAEDAKESLLNEYDEKYISEDMIVAKTYILQVGSERLWEVYESEIAKVIKKEKQPHLNYVQSMTGVGELAHAMEDARGEWKEAEARRYNISVKCEDEDEDEDEECFLVEDAEDELLFEIPANLVYNKEIAPHLVVNREKEVLNLKELEELLVQNGCDESDETLISIRKHLQVLCATNEKFIIATYGAGGGVNGYFTKQSDIKKFNEACRELISTFLEVSE